MSDQCYCCSQGGCMAGCGCYRYAPDECVECGHSSARHPSGEACTYRWRNEAPCKCRAFEQAEKDRLR